RRPRRVADRTLDFRPRAAAERTGAGLLHAAPAAARLGDVDIGRTLDHAHPCPARRSTGHARPVSLPVASELRGGGWRDRAAAARPNPARAGAALQRADRRGADGAYPHRKPRARRSREPHRLLDVTATTITIDDAPAATWAGFSLMCLGMFMAILDIQVVAT